MGKIQTMADQQSTDQSEHEFLKFCDSMSNETDRSWHMMQVNFAKVFDQTAIIRNLTESKAYLKTRREEALVIFNTMNIAAKDLQTAAQSYIFADNDIILFGDIRSTAELNRFQNMRLETTKTLPPGVDIDIVETLGNMRRIRNLAEQKIITARHMRAMNTIADSSMKRDTLPLRRQSRDVPLIMLVEDDRFTAAYTTQLLSGNYEVFHVRSGEEAIEYYLDYAPDAVFIDLHLPGINGHDVLRMIKAIDPSAYCVVLSVDSSQRAVIGASNGGAESFLRKPYNKERLLWTVRQSPHLMITDAIRSISTP
jgi:CheY-like chemotaxis protein